MRPLHINQYDVPIMEDIPRGKGGEKTLARPTAYYTTSIDVLVDKFFIVYRLTPVKH